jgi:hypothetical protein
MRRFLNRLFRDFRTSRSARGGLRGPRRAALQVEGLEDRLVMTSVTHIASPVPTNAIPADSSVAQTRPIVQLTSTNAIVGHLTTSESITFTRPGVIYIRSDGAGNTDVFELGGRRVQFRTWQMSSVSVFVESGNTNTDSIIYIDDSKGMPFAPNTTVDLNGTGPILLNLYGSQTVNGNELYVAGGAPWTPGTIGLANVTFTLHSAITDVSDTIRITGNLDVQTSGTSVQLLSFGPGRLQQLSGMGVGGGDSLNYANKPVVTLETYAPNTSIFLDAPDAAPAEDDINVNMHAAGETTTIDSTPKNVATVANAGAANAFVALWGNFGPVIVDGNSSTAVNVGYPLSSTGVVTRGIEANVTVHGASSLVVNDSGNTSTVENVTVTDHTISGSGLFGNGRVTLQYLGVNNLDILTGQREDDYTVEPFSPNAQFTNSITIDSNSNVAFYVSVSVYANSNLHLTLNNSQPRYVAAQLNFSASAPAVPPGDFFVGPANGPNGTIYVWLYGQITSQITYSGFENA